MNVNKAKGIEPESQFFSELLETLSCPAVVSFVYDSYLMWHVSL